MAKDLIITLNLKMFVCTMIACVYFRKKDIHDAILQIYFPTLEVFDVFITFTSLYTLIFYCIYCWMQNLCCWKNPQCGPKLNEEVNILWSLNINCKWQKIYNYNLMIAMICYTSFNSFFKIHYLRRKNIFNIVPTILCMWDKCLLQIRNIYCWKGLQCSDTK